MTKPLCYVPGCKSGYSRTNGIDKRHFFSAPKDEGLRLSWNKKIRRIDKELTPKSYLCDLHFSEEDIVKVDEFIIEGKAVTLPKTIWKLKEGAVPIHFPTYPSYLNTPNGKKRKPPRNREVQAVTYKKPKAVKVLAERKVDECVEVNRAMLEGRLLEAPLTFEDLIENRAMISLPSSSWGCHIITSADHLDIKYLCISEMMNMSFPLLKKAIVVRPDLKIEVWVGSNNCSDLQTDKPKRFADVGVVVSKINEMCLCSGCQSFTDIVSCASGQLLGDTWYSKDCHIFLLNDEKDACSKCLQLKKCLLVYRNRQQNNDATSLLKRDPSTLSQDQLIGVLRMKNNDIRNLEKQVHRLSVTHLKNNFRIKTMEKEMLMMKRELRKAQLANKKFQKELRKSQKKEQQYAVEKKQTTGTVTDTSGSIVFSISSCHYEEVIAAVSCIEG